MNRKLQNTPPSIWLVHALWTIRLVIIETSRYSPNIYSKQGAYNSLWNFQMIWGQDAVLLQHFSYWLNMWILPIKLAATLQRYINLKTTRITCQDAPYPTWTFKEPSETLATCRCTLDLLLSSIKMHVMLSKPSKTFLENFGKSQFTQKAPIPC